MSQDRMKLKGITTLVADSDSHALVILQQMMRGLGMDPPTVAHGGQEARTLLESKNFDLCLLEADLPDISAADLIRDLRRKPPPLKFLPVIVITGYSHLRNVMAARDAGAHSVVKKPVSPQSLYDHIAWAAQPNRNFIETDTYIGPDRRFKFMGPPNGVGRRASDLSAEIGEATEPNMSQDEIDAMIRPTRVVAA